MVGGNTASFYYLSNYAIPTVLWRASQQPHAGIFKFVIMRWLTAFPVPELIRTSFSIFNLF